MNELPNMPPRDRIGSLIEQHHQQSIEINKMREERRGTRSKIIEAMRDLKKGELKITKDDTRYTFRIVPGDSKLEITVSNIRGEVG